VTSTRLRMMQRLISCAPVVCAAAFLGSLCRVVAIGFTNVGFLF
jgi:hypothetical protein